MSNNQIIASLKARLESERNDEMTAYELCTGPVGYRNGHQAATERLMTIVEKALAVIEFYADPESYFAIGFFPDNPCGDFFYDGSETHLGKKPGKKAREFLLSISETVADASTLADASGEITKPGHYIINAESFDKIIDDLDKEPSEQVKKAREKFLQLKKEAPDENK